MLIGGLAVTACWATGCDWPARQPALSMLCTASVHGLPAANREILALRPRPSAHEDATGAAVNAAIREREAAEAAQVCL